ncbi:MAG: hypothetical protein Q9P90_02465 [candidate division KSB1 bacterium]|nr:hypothetical protein [candidate division KSB1 bacterium]
MARSSYINRGKKGLNRTLVALLVWIIAGMAVGGIHVLLGQVRQSLSEHVIVDWTDFQLTAQGGARYPEQAAALTRGVVAVEAARMQAFRYLWEGLQQLIFDADDRLVERFARDAALQQTCYRLARGFTITDVQFRQGDSVTVEIALPLTGMILKALLPPWQQELRWLETLGNCPICQTPWPTVVPPSDSTGHRSASAYSSIILLPGELSFSPALNARVLDEYGQEVYGHAYLDPEYRGDIPTLRYLSLSDRQRINELAGKQPLLIHVQTISGRLKTDLVVSHADAVRMHNSGAEHELLRRGRVYVLSKRNFGP